MAASSSNSDGELEEGQAQLERFRILYRNDRIPEGYSLPSVDEVKEIISSSDEMRKFMNQHRSQTLRLRDGWMRKFMNQFVVYILAEFKPYDFVYSKLVVNRKIDKLSKRIEASRISNPYTGKKELQSWIREFLYDCGEGWISEGDVAEYRKVLQGLNGAAVVDVETGWTPLHAAAFGIRSNTALVCMLLDHGAADPNMKDNRGSTPLHCAALHDNEEVVRVLLDHGAADPNMKDNRGMTPLHCAALDGRVETVTVLLDHGAADPNMKDNQGRTPLHCAVEERKREMLALLIQRTDIIEESELKDAVRCIIEHEAALYLRDIMQYYLNHEKLVEKGWRLLRAVIGVSDEAGLFNDLLQFLANQNRLKLSGFRDDQGQTLMHYAVRYYNRGVGVDFAISNILDPLFRYICPSGEVSSIEEATEVYDLFWTEAPGINIAYTDATHEGMQDALLRWLCQCESFFLTRSGSVDPGREMSLKRAARSNMKLKRLCRQLFRLMGDKKWETDLRLMKTLEDKEWRATLNTSEIENVDQALESLKFETIFQNQEELEQHIDQATDQPTFDDVLGRKELANALAALILNPYVGNPITFGIYGDWGIGKSSLMLQMEIRLLQIVMEQAISKYENMGKQKHGGKFQQIIDVIAQSIRAQEKEKLESRQESSFLGNTQQTIEDQDNIFVFKLFISKYNKRYHSLYKTLGVIDISNMLPKTRTDEKHMPSILTVRYNAWQYQDETEALAGLAAEIAKEMEAAMTTAQWLSMCWCNSMTNRQHGKFPLLLLCFIALIVVFVVLITWLAWEKLFTSSNSGFLVLKYASGAVGLPVALLFITWIVLKNMYSFIAPVSKGLTAMFTPIQHQMNLGYHQQVIDDIRFLSKEICRTPSLMWRCLGWIWANIFRQNHREYSPETRVPKMIPSQNLRIVLFVDDMDRCNEDTILQVLSSINLVLSVCEINVVMGVDKSMLLRAIRKKYFSEDDPHIANELAERFLEKIVQLPVVLPDPGERRMVEFLASQMGFQSRETDPTMIVKPSKKWGHLDSIRVDPRYAADRVIDALLAKYSAHQCSMFVELQKYITEDPQHPREWKRVLNYHRLAYNVVKQKEEAKEFPDWDEELLVWVFVCWHWKKLMNEIIQNWKHICQTVRSQTGPSQTDPSQAGPSQAGPSQAGPSQTGPSQTGPTSLKAIVDFMRLQESTSNDEWQKMSQVLEKYDISMKGILMFQDYRFQCQQGHLQSPDELM